MSIPVFIIGLPDRYRGGALEVQLARGGFSFSRVDGVRGSYRGRALSELVDSAAASVVYGHELSAGEVGCALAHRDVYERFLALTSEWALVLEDDARLLDSESLRTLFTEVLGWPRAERPSILMLYARAVVGSRRLEARVGNSELRRLLISPYTATAYLINRDAAALILRDGLPLISPADWPLRTEGAIQFSCLYPWLFSPEEVTEESTVGNRVQTRGSLRHRILKRAAVFLHIRWILRRHEYRYYRVYWTREVLRVALQRLMGRNWPYRVPASFSTVPVASRAVMAIHRIFSWSGHAR